MRNGRRWPTTRSWSNPGPGCSLAVTRHPQPSALRAPVAPEDDAVAEGPGLDEAEPGGSQRFGERPRAAAEENRVDGEVELIHEVVREERGCETPLVTSADPRRAGFSSARGGRPTWSPWRRRWTRRPARRRPSDRRTPPSVPGPRRSKPSPSPGRCGISPSSGNCGRSPPGSWGVSPSGKRMPPPGKVTSAPSSALALPAANPPAKAPAPTRRATAPPTSTGWTASRRRSPALAGSGAGSGPAVGVGPAVAHGAA